MSRESTFASQLFKESESQVKHFVRETNLRDRHGNRLFTSPELAYVDKEEDMVKAGLLVSPAGEALLKNNSHLLQDIEYGLVDLIRFFRSTHEYEVEEMPDGRTLKSLKLGNNRRMRYLGCGGFSMVYQLVLPDRTLIIKRNLPNELHEFDFDGNQPLINEMLQVSALQADLAEDFKRLGISFPTYYFSTGQVLCVEYIEGKHPILDCFVNSPMTEAEAFQQRAGRAFELHDVVANYIASQQRDNNPLWKKITPDVLHAEENIIRLKNFIQKPDGSLVWIDPLYYQQF
ncbi:MAG TPA: hypothetical protein VD999_07005 [Vitreimonas sp.]|nr:hypothetical protein [Vitreimonas sp.]